MNAFRTQNERAPGETPARHSPRAVVIGSGFGGLAAAIRLSVMGYQVQVLEKLDAPGGRAYVHKQDGFTFDAGPTIITLPHLLEELFTLCGQRMEDYVDLRPMSPFYRIRFDDGTHFDYSNDEAAMLAQIEAISPSDVQGFKDLMKASAKCYELGFVELGSVPFETIGDVIKALPNLVRMKAWRSIHSMVARYLKHPKLRIVMSFHPLLIGGNPFSVTCVYSLIHILEQRWGVHSAMGGTGAIVNALVALQSACSLQRARHPNSRERRQGCCGRIGKWRIDRRRHRGQQRRCRMDLPPFDRRKRSAALEQPSH